MGARGFLRTAGCVSLAVNVSAISHVGKNYYRGACIITQLLYIMQIVMTDCAGHLTLLFICRYQFDASKFTFFETLVQNSFCTVFTVICSMILLF